ncbi:MAG: acyl transferase, partial [Bacteroidetes bacterium]|nr:acyl transferase [Bacteroidota bacterium]
MSAKEIHKHIFTLNSKSTEAEFNELAIAIFQYQYQHNVVYRQYVSNLKLNPENVKHYTEIPFLPIELFKTREVVCDGISDEAVCFSSSGTTGQVT